MPPAKKRKAAAKKTARTRVRRNVATVQPPDDVPDEIHEDGHDEIKDVVHDEPGRWDLMRTRFLQAWENFTRSPVKVLAAIVILVFLWPTCQWLFSSKTEHMMDVSYHRLPRQEDGWYYDKPFDQPAL